MSPAREDSTFYASQHSFHEQSVLSMSSVPGLEQALKLEMPQPSEALALRELIISWGNHVMKKPACVCRCRLLQIVVYRKRWGLLQTRGQGGPPLSASVTYHPSGSWVQGDGGDENVVELDRCDDCTSL